MYKLKIDPPKEWSANSERIDDNELLDTCVPQNVIKLPMRCFDILSDVPREMTYGDLKKIAEEKEINFENVNQAEDIFWTQIGEERIYSIHNPITLFGDSTIVWNLNKLTKDESNIHSKPHHRALKVCILFTVF